MLVIGAKNHAKEILDILEKKGEHENLFFYDDISSDIQDKFYGNYKIIRSISELNSFKQEDKIFVIGIGNPYHRKKMSQKFLDSGWTMKSVISSFVILGNHNVHLGNGLNIMNNVMISNDTKIDDGTLVNAGVLIHHDVEVGKYCELSPRTCLTGNVLVGNNCFIGAGAVVLPKVKIGDNCVIGAGSVVNRDIPENTVAFGVPAKVIRKNVAFD